METKKVNLDKFPIDKMIFGLIMAGSTVTICWFLNIWVAILFVIAFLVFSD